MKQVTITISRKGAERARAGHLWIYRSDLTGGVGDTPGGTIVHVRDERSRFVGSALYSDRSQIALRLLTWREETIDRDWWRERLRASFARRAGLASDADAFRLIYAEGDALPSLIVDRYADVLVLQTLSQATDALKEMFVELLCELLNPRAIIERNDVRVRGLEGLPLTSGVLYGDAPEEMEVSQHGTRFRIAPLGGQKTGAFLDQRENHLAARRYATGRALDCFTFNGAFALHMAHACESVLGLDISAEAVAASRRNAGLNNLTNVEFREANVFDALREMQDAGERFDTIVLDPPAFAKNRASVPAAARGYKEINLRALKLLNPGGTLITCTCSYHMNETQFQEVIAEASADARRRLQIIERRIQSGDHPVLVGVPETLYLKCIVARAVD
ncbi:MAG TPA: class I SAM-dependent rRNA methyltransferase [Pyrinomonadaceae bacterium]|jgi:23S rRNA (cytosine1962-C5)-methyltransferase|nr:class I SAM-dependent rRNA methyltransferase [Pyrinomonadaceae bacterium]